MPRSRPVRHLAAVAAVALACCSLGAVAGASRRVPARRPGSRTGRQVFQGVPIHHVVEVMLENHTYDNLFAGFPGADGIPAATRLPDRAAPGGVARPLVAPANEGDVQAGLNNSRAAELAMMDRRGGRYRMDGYPDYPGEGLSSITTFAATTDPDLQSLARHFELLDRNFQPAVAPTLPNVLEALTGTTHGELTNAVPDAGTWRSIFDELQAAGRSWRIYSGVPPSIYAGTVWSRLLPQGSSANLEAATGLFADLARGRLPAFSFVRPGVGYSEEPPEDVGEGDAWLGQVVSAIAHSRYWRSTAIFVTYDEGGGFYDHVPPPTVAGSQGYGTRTPVVIVSPWVRGGVDGATTTNLSVLAFTQHCFGLPPLDRLNAVQNDLAGAFDFHRRPLPPPRLPVAPPATIGFYGPSQLQDVPAVAPGRPVTLNLRQNSPGLALERVTGQVRLSVVAPAGVPAGTAGVPAAVTMSGGTASVTVRPEHPGYYRIEARGPRGSLGWLTLDVGVSPETP